MDQVESVQYQGQTPVTNACYQESIILHYGLLHYNLVCNIILLLCTVQTSYKEYR